MSDQNLKGLNDVEKFLNGTTGIEFSYNSSKERYRWIAKTLKRFGYFSLTKKDKGIVQAYILKVTAFSRQHLTRLVKQYNQKHWIGSSRAKRNQFTTKYLREDVSLLAEVDKCHDVLSGPATKKLLVRACQVFNDPSYERLSQISVSHIYNLRKTYVYKQKVLKYQKTKKTQVRIASRRKPTPNGQPGYLRVDTVHQGDRDKVKGVYYINVVDEITQFEVVCSVCKISEHYLIPVLKAILKYFPFKINGFHSDNGSEYINHRVAKLLNKLHIEFTKSRSRHSNDNGLCESKNGSIIRKYFGYGFISQEWAPLINEFCLEKLVPYLNYHRPCYFPEIKIDKKGKEKRTYPYESIMTPFEKLKSLPNAKDYLKPDSSFEALDEIAMSMTDLESAKQLQSARSILFNKIFSDALP